MTIGSAVREGMLVVGDDKGLIGTVKEVRDTDFLIDRPLHRDIYAPFDAIANVRDNTIRLNVASDKIHKTGWPKYPIG